MSKPGPMSECFACGRVILKTPHVVRVNGETTRVYVGPDCYRHIARAGADGHQPSRGGPRLYLDDDRSEQA